MAPSSTSGPAVDQKDIPAASSKPAAASPVSPSSALPGEDLYTYEHCTILIVMQLRPQREVGGPRSVLMSVQNGTANKEELPLYRVLASEEELGGPLPPALSGLLEALRHDLPARRQRHAQLTPKQVVSGTTTRTLPIPKKGGKPQQAPPPRRPPPAVPAMTSSPPETTELVLGSLFDNL